MKKPVHYIDSIYYDLELTSNALKILGAQVFEKFDVGISITEHAALDTIFCNAGICQRDLAKLLLKDRANTGRILDSLEEKGLITRFVDLKNNRLVKKMGVTEKGHQKLEEVNKKLEDYFKDMKLPDTSHELELQLQQSLREFRKVILEVANINI